MPRSPRIVVPGVPLHITHRGVDRGPTFLCSEDYAFYLWALRNAVTRCAVHAYVLMTNHVHLLVTPTTASDLAAFMMSVGRRYVRYFNDRYRRTGTLWEGRFRSTVVDDATYLFRCSRYIELNPVRAGIVRDPREYDWSSFSHNALGRPDLTVTPHDMYLALGVDSTSRGAAYLDFFGRDLEPRELAGIRAELRSRPQPDRVAYRQLVDTAGRMGAWSPRGGITHAPTFPTSSAARAAVPSGLDEVMPREH